MSFEKVKQAAWWTAELLPFVPADKESQEKIGERISAFRRSKTLRYLPVCFVLSTGICYQKTEAQCTDPFQALFQVIKWIGQYATDYKTQLATWSSYISDYYRPVKETYRQYQQIKQSAMMMSRLAHGDVNSMVSIAIPMLDMDPGNPIFQAGNANKLSRILAKDWSDAPDSTASSMTHKALPTYKDLLAGLLMEMDRSASDQIADGQTREKDLNKAHMKGSEMFMASLLGAQTWRGGYDKSALDATGGKSIAERVSGAAQNQYEKNADRHIAVLYSRMNALADDPDSIEYYDAYWAYMDALEERGYEGGSHKNQTRIAMAQNALSEWGDKPADRVGAQTKEQTARLNQNEESAKKQSAIGNTYNSPYDAPVNAGVEAYLIGGNVDGGKTKEGIGMALKQAQYLESIQQSLSEIRKLMLEEARLKHLDAGNEKGSEAAVEAAQGAAKDENENDKEENAEQNRDEMNKTITNDSIASGTVTTNANYGFVTASMSLEHILGDAGGGDGVLDLSSMPEVPVDLEGKPIDSTSIPGLIAGLPPPSPLPPNEKELTYIVKTGNVGEASTATSKLMGDVEKQIKDSMQKNVVALEPRIKSLFSGTAKKASIGFLNPLLRGFYKGINSVFGNVFDVDDEVSKWAKKGDYTTVNIDAKEGTLQSDYK